MMMHQMVSIAGIYVGRDQHSHNTIKLQHYSECISHHEWLQIK